MKSYKNTCNISKPVLLNCWKHHAGFIRSMIKQYRRGPGTHLDSLLSEILLIGESLMDLYLGELTPKQIADSTIQFSRQNEIFNIEDFKEWLKEERTDYRIIQLGDRSKWTLRLGRKEDRYIHIHPSRYSPHTLRIRSTSLKSAILVRVLAKHYSGNQLVKVNSIRKEYLDLPPLKSLKSGSALLSLIKLLG
jgi:hypothetical protein